jgi:hypothetical protein
MSLMVSAELSAGPNTNEGSIVTISYQIKALIQKNKKQKKKNILKDTKVWLFFLDKIPSSLFSQFLGRNICNEVSLGSFLALGILVGNWVPIFLAVHVIRVCNGN